VVTLLSLLSLLSRLSLTGFLSFVVAITWVSSVSAAVPVVDKHDLNCGDTFPCPPEIQRRVDFWVMVFRAWNVDQIVLHDANRPERVYFIKKTKFTCSRRKPARSIERERTRIKKALISIAKKLTQAAPRYTGEEKTLLALFPSKSAKEVRTAADNVRCQQGNRNRFLEALKRYETYKSHILRVLRETGLSEDILYLPFVESAYNPRAYSRVGAAGLWQIMPRTARTLGLQLSATIDERFDAEAATWAAARYLRQSTDSLTAKARKIDPSVTSARINPFVITPTTTESPACAAPWIKSGPTILPCWKSISRAVSARPYETFIPVFWLPVTSRRTRTSILAISKPMIHSGIQSWC